MLVPCTEFFLVARCCGNFRHGEGLRAPGGVPGWFLDARRFDGLEMTVQDGPTCFSPSTCQGSSALLGCGLAEAEALSSLAVPAWSMTD